MAKYTINYGCGHSCTMQMYGKVAERERKAEWLSRQLCPECYKKSQMEKVMADETPVKIKVSLNIANLSDNNMIVINAIAEGGTYREKENLKALGFVFGDAPMSGLFGLFDRPSKVWHKVVQVGTIDSIVDALKFGNYPVINGITDIDIAAMRDKLLAIDEANKSKSEIRLSPLRSWIAETYGSPYWNGKVYESGVAYGKAARVYLDNKEREIPADVYAAQIEWRKRRDAINAKEATK